MENLIPAKLENKTNIESSYEVVMTTYKGSKFEFLQNAVDSVIASMLFARDRLNNPSIKLVIGVDGPISDDKFSYLDKINKQHTDISVLWFENNLGLGATLRSMIAASHANFIIRMDDDDLMLPERILHDIELHEAGAEIVSSVIGEFIDSPDELISLRIPAVKLTSLRSYFRNPLNHVATSFNKELVLEAGNYRDIKFFEDWDLWLRLKSLNYVSSQKILVKVRVGKEMFARRTGYQMVKSEFNFFLRLLRDRNIGAALFFFALVLRTMVRLLPNQLYANFMFFFLRRDKFYDRN